MSPKPRVVIAQATHMIGLPTSSERPRDGLARAFTYIVLYETVTVLTARQVTPSSTKTAASCPSSATDMLSCVCTDHTPAIVAELPMTWKYIGR